jgi:hypothetical protein
MCIIFQIGQDIVVAEEVGAPAGAVRMFDAYFGVSIG